MGFFNFICARIRYQLNYVRKWFRNWYSLICLSVKTLLIVTPISLTNYRGRVNNGQAYVAIKITNAASLAVLDVTNPFVQTAPLNLGGLFLEQRKQKRFNKRAHSTLAIKVQYFKYLTVSLFLCCAGSNARGNVEGPWRAPLQKPFVDENETM